MEYNNKIQIHTEKSKKVQSGPFCFFVWIFKVEIVIIAIFLLLYILSSLISDKTKFVIKYNIENALYNQIKNEKANIKDVFVALDENKNLSNDEKAFIRKNLEEEIKENIEYIDLSKVIKRVNNLETSYHKKYIYNSNINKYELQNHKVYLRKVGADYNSIFNRINIYEQIKDNKLNKDYEKEIFDFSDTDKMVYFHELNHLLTKNTILTYIDAFSKNLRNNNTSKSFKIANKAIFLEPINEMFTLEYFQENDEYSYNENMIYLYVLVEILPEDVIREYKFYDNQSILISGLLEIEDNVDKVYELFYYINKVCENNGTEEDFEKIHDIYSFFYEKRYNKIMSEDIEILLYLYGSEMQTAEERIYIRDYLDMEEFDEILTVIPKGYFSNKCKENHKKIQIKYSKDGNIRMKNI